jgi:hypothetical protein
MKETQTQAIEGFFIAFSPEEVKIVREELERQGYTPDGGGLKKLLLDIMYDDGPEEKESDTERFVRKAQNFLKENPATVKMGMSALKGIAGMIAKSRK